jgi:hypothetical protein
VPTVTKSVSLNLPEPYRPVMGLLYLYLYNAPTCFNAILPSSGGLCPVPAKLCKHLNAIIERCTCEIKSRITMAKVAFNKKRALFTSKMDLELRKKLVKCYIWSIALYGAETWTL